MRYHSPLADSTASGPVKSTQMIPSLCVDFSPVWDTGTVKWTCLSKMQWSHLGRSSERSTGIPPASFFIAKSYIYGLRVSMAKVVVPGVKCGKRLTQKGMFDKEMRAVELEQVSIWKMQPRSQQSTRRWLQQDASEWEGNNAVEGVNKACDWKKADSGGRYVKDIVQCDMCPLADDKSYGSDTNSRDRRAIDTFDEQVCDRLEV